MKAAVLAGGRGTRLRPITLAVPKALLPVAHIPILLHQFERFRAAGIREATALLSRGDGVDWDRFEGVIPEGMTVVPHWEESPLGTGGAFRQLLEWLGEEELFGINGDDITDADPAHLLELHRDRQADVTLGLIRVVAEGDLSRDDTDHSVYGNVVVDGEGWVERFLEKPDPEASTGLLNAGQYVISPDALASLPADRPFSIEREGFPSLLDAGLRVAAVELAGYHRPINTPAQYLQVHRDLYEGLWEPPWLAGAKGHNQIGSNCKIFPNARLGDNVTLGDGSQVGSDARLSDVIAFPGAKIGRAARITRSVLGPGVHVGHHAEVTGSVLAAGTFVPPWSSLGKLEPGRRGETAT